MRGIGRNKLVGVVVAALFVAGSAQADKRRQLEELINFALGTEYSHWLAGPIARIASESEIDAYLQFVDDEAAASFIDSFWDKRSDASNPWPDQQPQAVFESRSQEADRRFTEGVTPGRRTDRGTIFVVYGEPLEIDYEDKPDSRYGSIEVWRYGKKADRGLDGERPKKLYRFFEKDGLTVFYAPSPSPRRRSSRGVIR